MHTAEEYSELELSNSHVVCGDVVVDSSNSHADEDDGAGGGATTLSTTPKSAPVRVDHSLNPLIEGPLTGESFLEYDLDDPCTFTDACRVPGPEEPQPPRHMRLFLSRNKKSFRVFEELGPSPETWKYVFTVKKASTSLRTTAQDMWVVQNEVLQLCTGGVKVYHCGRDHTTKYRVTTTMQQATRDLACGTITTIAGQPISSTTTLVLADQEGHLPYPSRPNRKCSAREATATETLKTRAPRWNPARKRFELVFGKRVRVLHSSNIQVVLPSADDALVLQFGKCAKSEYALDYSAPLTVVQAVGLAIAHWCASRRKVRS